MKNKILIAFAILAIYSCQNKEKPVQENIVKKIAEDTLAKTVAGTADVSDVPAKDDKTIEIIRKQLLVLLKKDLPGLTKEDRFFYYDTFDLNNDQKDEYFVGFSNPYFCGSGGCSGYILNNDGSLMNSFTVTEFPIFAAPIDPNKSVDLVFESKNNFHLMKMKNGKYPSNPSIQEVWKGKISEDSPKILDIQSGKLEKYSF
ncbi:MAG: hypothetical protein ABI850_04660 [Flavobacterium sp.]